jgi:hypothetical protein
MEEKKIVMEEKKFYSVVLHYLGHKREAVIAFDPSLIDYYLTRGYAIEFISPIHVLTGPFSD